MLKVATFGLDASSEVGSPLFDRLVNVSKLWGHCDVTPSSTHGKARS